MHLKGGCGVQAIRWSFVGFLFVLFVMSVTVLVLSAVTYAEIRVAFDEVQSQRKFDYDPNALFNEFKPEAALGVFYVGISLGVIFTLISCIGSCGAACLDRCFLLSYVVSLSIVLFGSIITLAVITHIHSDDMKKMAAQLYKEFVNHMYGRPEVPMYFLGKAIDAIQQQHKCCGVLDLTDSKATMAKYGTTSSHYTILYWLESTQWGQIQANNIQYDENGSLAYVPESCCVSKTKRPGCSVGVFGDRMLSPWPEELDKEWEEKIYVVGCGRHLLNFDHLEGGTRALLIGLGIFVITIVLATLVLACWLWQAVASYEFSSRDSELDKRRHHRRRRHRRHRRHRRDKDRHDEPTQPVVGPEPASAPKSLKSILAPASTVSGLPIKEMLALASKSALTQKTPAKTPIDVKQEDSGSGSKGGGSGLTKGNGSSSIKGGGSSLTKLSGFGASKGSGSGPIKTGAGALASTTISTKTKTAALASTSKAHPTATATKTNVGIEPVSPKVPTKPRNLHGM